MWLDLGDGRSARTAPGRTPGPPDAVHSGPPRSNSKARMSPRAVHRQCCWWALAAALFFPHRALADWTSPQGLKVWDSGPNVVPSATSDGAGGAYLVWAGGTSGNIFVERVNGMGVAPNGWPG